jgi:hypothetical protein
MPSNSRIISTVASLFSKPCRRKSAAFKAETSAADVQVLEDRRLMTADLNDQAREATNYGALTSKVTTVEGAINWRTDVDVIKFTAVPGQKIAAAVVGMGYVEPRLRLFGPLLNRSTPQPLRSVSNNDGLGTARLEYTVTKAGTYYLGVSATDNAYYNINSGRGDFSSRYVSNSRAVGDYHLIFADDGPRADLTGSSLTAKATTSTNGKETVDYSFSIRNTGKASSGAFNVAIYASSNSVISTADTLLTTIRVAGIQAGQTYNSGSRSISLPAGLSIPDSGLYIGMRVDSSSEIEESNENNNDNVGVSSDLTLVRPTSLPDLQGTNFDVRADQLAPGQVATVYVQINNTGTASSGQFQVTLYASSNNFITTADTRLETLTLDSIAAGSNRQFSTLVKIPDDYSAIDGAFSIGMIIDSLDAVRESKEDNNSNTGPGLDYDQVNFRAPAVAKPGMTTVQGPGSTENQQPTFNWTAVADATHYEIRITDIATGTIAMFNSGLNGTSFTPSTKLAAGNYSVEVRAWNGTQAGEWGGALKCSITKAPVILIPQKPVVTVPGSTPDTTPTFTWKPVADATHYSVTITDAATGKLIAEDTSVSATNYRLESELAIGNYRIQVTAWNRNVRGTAGDVQSFRIVQPPSTRVYNKRIGYKNLTSFSAYTPTTRVNSGNYTDYYTLRAAVVTTATPVHNVAYQFKIVMTQGDPSDLKLSVPGMTSVNINGNVVTVNGTYAFKTYKPGTRFVRGASVGELKLKLEYFSSSVPTAKYTVTVTAK